MFFPKQHIIIVCLLGLYRYRQGSVARVRARVTADTLLPKICRNFFLMFSNGGPFLLQLTHSIHPFLNDISSLVPYLHTIISALHDQKWIPQTHIITTLLR